MLIGELVKKSGLSKATIRYYEKIGILNEKVVCRNPENGYKIYSSEALELLKMLEIGKQHGATLNEIKTLLDTHQEEGLTCYSLAPVIIKKLDDIDLKIQELQTQKQNLELALNQVNQCFVLKGQNEKEGSSEQSAKRCDKKSL